MKKIDMRERRKELRLTIEQLAAKAGVSPGTIRQIEVDAIKSPAFMTRHKIADALGLSFKELWPEAYRETAELMATPGWTKRKKTSK